jgi:hydrogenase maturation protein HypF
MDQFEMCSSCTKEYNEPEDRRFYSQTNSCPDCPVILSLYNSDRERIQAGQNEVISIVSEALLQGKIVAVKGIGGYLLMADATSEAAIVNLRKRKRRPTKPFALMYPDIAEAEKDVFIYPQIHRMWESPESPIVLCLAREKIISGIKKELIAPGLNRLGIMIPYAPLFLLLMRSVRKPLIATSGNITESPIIYDDLEALDSLAGIADYVLVNNREIVVPQDDSVIQYTPFSNHLIIIRRSRGMAPAFPVQKFPGVLKEPILSMGAMLKSTFCIYHRARTYISQYLGNTETLESQENYESVLNHLNRVLDFRPARILVDLHPDYPATVLGEEISDLHDIPLERLQHHEAHAFAVLGENNILDKDDILCVVWDGTGLGSDHHIWGGEFFIYQKQSLSRIGYLSYFPHLSGDKMAVEPRLSVLALLSGFPDMADRLKEKFNDQELSNYKKILEYNRLQTSSAGRLFDAVASLLGFSDYNSYEGESAMYLETAACEVYLKYPDFDLYFEPVLVEDKIIDVFDLIRKIVSDTKKGSLSRGEIALKFHVTLVRSIELFAITHHLSHLAFSGGVFQNAVLVDLLHRDLNDQFELYFHRDLSPNDECISYGQMVTHSVHRQRSENLNYSRLKL